MPLHIQSAQAAKCPCAMAVLAHKARSPPVPIRTPRCQTRCLQTATAVLHDIDQMTSTFIHLSPALLFWCLRWGGGFGPGRIETAWP
eukprot:SAG11_NODE_17773_length_509_cov_1.080488_1_plen_86_part_01